LPRPERRRSHSIHMSFLVSELMNRHHIHAAAAAPAEAVPSEITGRASPGSNGSGRRVDMLRYSRRQPRWCRVNDVCLVSFRQRDGQCDGQRDGRRVGKSRAHQPGMMLPDNRERKDHECIGILDNPGGQRRHRAIFDCSRLSRSIEWRQGSRDASKHPTA